MSIDELLGVAAGQDPPFEAWREFLETPAGQGMTEPERRFLQGQPWPPGIRPSVGAYLTILHGLRAAEAS